jgi:hypothetical protein
MAGGDEQTNKVGGSGAARELLVPEASGSSAAPPVGLFEEQTNNDGEVPTGELVVAAPPVGLFEEQTNKDGEVPTGELVVPEASGSDFESELDDELVAAMAKLTMGGEGKGGEGGADPPGTRLPVTPLARAKRAGSGGESPAGKQLRTREEVTPPGKCADLALFTQPGPQTL